MSMEQAEIKLPFKRVLLKLSGEILGGNHEHSLDEKVLTRLAQEAEIVHNLGVELIIVVGGGNIFRYSTYAHQIMDRVNADYMGMTATIINALALQDYFEQFGLNTRVMSAIHTDQLAEPFIRRRALRHIEKGRIIILAAGTGNPYFTTDTAAVLRASELKCQILLKGTKVKGVYSSDPKKNKKAIFFKVLNHDQVIKRGLKVMDATAFTLAKDNDLPIFVFDITKKDNLIGVIKGTTEGTLIKSD